jgi:hypothetical protein
MSLVSEFKSFLNEGPFDFVPLLNGVVYSFGFLVFGTPAWKCLVLGVIVFVVSRMRYGRRLLFKFGVLILLTTMTVWAGIVPAPDEWSHIARAMMSGVCS